MKRIICFIICLSLFPLLSGCKKGGERELSFYDIKVTLFEDMTLSGSLEYGFTCFEDGLESFCFNLYPNAFRKDAEVSPIFESDYLLVYENGFSSGSIDILSVKAQGEKVDFSVGETNLQILEVHFNEPLKKGEKCSVYIEFKVVLPNAIHRFGYGENTINLTGFYPIACFFKDGEFVKNFYYPAGDPFFSECANYNVSLTVPSTFTVASSLKAVGTVWSGGTTEYLYERNSVRDIAFILSEDYNVARKNANGVTVSYYYYLDDNPEKTLQTAVESLNFFSDKFYRYPYGEYVVCEGDFIYGGMEYPCLSLIADTVGEYRDYTVAHETAHQWFYGIVGVNQSEEGYLDEGLTELVTVLFMDGKSGKSYDDYIAQAKNSYRALDSALKVSGNLNPPVMNRNLKEFSSEGEYVLIAYKRSLIAFDELRAFCGDKKFFKTLKRFVSSNAFSTVSSEDFINSFDKAKRGSRELLQDFIQGKAKV